LFICNRTFNYQYLFFIPGDLSNPVFYIILLEDRINITKKTFSGGQGAAWGRATYQDERFPPWSRQCWKPWTTTGPSVKFSNEENLQHAWKMACRGEKEKIRKNMQLPILNTAYVYKSMLKKKYNS
jgi:hypothetical protein